MNMNMLIEKVKPIMTYFKLYNKFKRKRQIQKKYRNLYNNKISKPITMAVALELNYLKKKNSNAVKQFDTPPMKRFSHYNRDSFECNSNSENSQAKKSFDKLCSELLNHIENRDRRYERYSTSYNQSRSRRYEYRDNRYSHHSKFYKENRSPRRSSSHYSNSKYSSRSSRRRRDNSDSDVDSRSRSSRNEHRRDYNRKHSRDDYCKQGRDDNRKQRRDDYREYRDDERRSDRRDHSRTRKEIDRSYDRYREYRYKPSSYEQTNYRSKRNSSSNDGEFYYKKHYYEGRSHVSRRSRESDRQDKIVKKKNCTLNQSEKSDNEYIARNKSTSPDKQCENQLIIEKKLTDENHQLLEKENQQLLEREHSSENKIIKFRNVNRPSTFFRPKKELENGFRPPSISSCKFGSTKVDFYRSPTVHERLLLKYNNESDIKDQFYSNSKTIDARSILNRKYAHS